jgi:ABC-type histidine transport system ATPase subunit
MIRLERMSKSFGHPRVLRDGFARDVADRLIATVDGAIVEEGPSSQIFAAPKRRRVRQFLQSILVRYAELGDETAS